MQKRILFILALFFCLLLPVGAQEDKTTLYFNQIGAVNELMRYLDTCGSIYTGNRAKYILMRPIPAVTQYQPLMEHSYRNVDMWCTNIKTILTVYLNVYFCTITTTNIRNEQPALDCIYSMAKDYFADKKFIAAIEDYNQMAVALSSILKDNGLSELVEIPKLKTP